MTFPLQWWWVFASSKVKIGGVFVATTIAVVTVIATGGPGGGSGPGLLAPCDQTVSSSASLVTTARSAAVGSTVCVSAGSYGATTLTSGRTGVVTIRPVTGATVTFADLNTEVGASYYTIRGVHVSSSLDIGARTSGPTNHIVVRDSYLFESSWWTGATDIVFDHNEFANGSNLIEALGGNRITINGNRFLNATDDAMFITSGWQNVTITDNEIIGVTENGNHNDCLQSYLGGTNMTYSGNYLHDNRCQGFFLKDGAVSGTVNFTDNLFVNNNATCVPACAAGSPQIFQTGDVANLIVRRNTVWDNQGGWVYRDWGEGPDQATMDHNVVETIGRVGTPPLTEDFDIFGEAPNGFTKGTNSVINANPTFVNTATNDYRIAGSDKGVDWRPVDKVFGPQ